MEGVQRERAVDEGGEEIRALHRPMVAAADRIERGMAERSGLLALGDSITYGEGGIVLGVDGRSWALWLAQAMDLPYTNYARPGAVVSDVLVDQLPRVRRMYDLGVLYIGVNDVRSPGFVLEAFTRQITAAVVQLAPHAERLAVLTMPLDLGRPRAGSKVAEANAAIRAAAEQVGADVVSLVDLQGERFVLPDAVHPTALGQLEIADRAARELGVSVLPSVRTPPSRQRRAVLATAVDWRRMWVREALRRTRERVAR